MVYLQRAAIVENFTVLTEYFARVAMSGTNCLSVLAVELITTRIGYTYDTCKPN